MNYRRNHFPKTILARLIGSLFLLIPMLMQAQPGSLDLTFGFGGIVVTSIGVEDASYSVALQDDGKIVVAGSSNSGTEYDFVLARYMVDGQLDSTFGSDGIVITSIGVDDVALSVKIQADRKIVAAGYTANGNQEDFALARYHADGSLDSTFDGDGIAITSIGTNDECNAIALQGDGKIVAAGRSSSINDDLFTLARYESDGRLDSSFGIGGIVVTPFANNAVALSVSIQRDSLPMVSKIVASGAVENGAGYDFVLVRFDSIIGSLDSTFDSDGIVISPYPSDAGGMSSALQNDGKIVVAGSIQNGSDYDMALLRYNTDGSVDTTFDNDGLVITPVLGNDYAASLSIQNDGKIIVTGLSCDSDCDIALARYNMDGSPDLLFDADGIVTTSLGNNYEVGRSLAVQADGRIVVSGYTDGGSSRIALLRYGNIQVEAEAPSMENTSIDFFPNPTTGAMTMHWFGATSAQLSVYNSLGEEILNQVVRSDYSFELTTKGVYYAKVLKGRETLVKKIIFY